MTNRRRMLMEYTAYALEKASSGDTSEGETPSENEEISAQEEEE